MRFNYEVSGVPQMSVSPCFAQPNYIYYLSVILIFKVNQIKPRKDRIKNGCELVVNIVSLICPNKIRYGKD